MQTSAKDSAPDVSVIVVNFNTKHLLPEMFSCLRLAAGSLNIQVIIVDNASQDNSATWIRQTYPDLQLIANDKNIGFGRANNLAIPFVRGRYVLLLNTDAFAHANSLANAVNHMDENPLIGVLGVRLIGRDGHLQPSCRYFPTPLNVFLQRTGLSQCFPGVTAIDDMNWDHLTSRECDWVPGCFYLIRACTLATTGLFDPRYFLYYEEVDHCRRMKAEGWKIGFLGSTTCIHVGGESAATVSKISSGSRQIPALQVESELIYFRKHYGIGGVLVHMLLALTGDLFLNLKHLLKRMIGRASTSPAPTFAPSIASARKTNFGSAACR